MGRLSFGVGSDGPGDGSGQCSVSFAARTATPVMRPTTSRLSTHTVTSKRFSMSVRDNQNTRTPLPPPWIRSVLSPTPIDILPRLCNSFYFFFFLFTWIDTLEHLSFLMLTAVLFLSFSSSCPPALLPSPPLLPIPYPPVYYVSPTTSTYEPSLLDLH